MKVGDLVKWIGYPGADAAGIKATGPEEAGIILSISKRTYRSPPRIDVMWGNGTVGRNLYIQTIELITSDYIKK